MSKETTRGDKVHCPHCGGKREYNFSYDAFFLPGLQRMAGGQMQQPKL